MAAIAFRRWVSATPVVRAGIVLLVGLLAGAVLLFAFGLVYQASILNPLGLWSAALVLVLATGAAVVVWRRSPAANPIDTRTGEAPPSSEEERSVIPPSPVKSETRVLIVDDDRPPPRRRPPLAAEDVPSLKRQFDQARRGGDLVAASRCLDALERHASERDWVAVKRRLLARQKARQ